MQYYPKKVYPPQKMFTTLIYPLPKNLAWIFKPCAFMALTIWTEL